MGFTRNKAWSIVIALIALILLNVVAFILPVYHGIHFWMGYSFAVFANIVLVVTAVVTLNKPNISKTFLGLPALSVVWIYFAIQTGLSIWQMTSFDFPYFAGVIINSALAAFVIITLILTNMGVKEIEKVDEKTAEKVFYIKNLKTDIELTETDNPDVSAKLKDLKDTVRFSDPMSHSQLTPLENKITNKFNILKENIDNPSIALTLCDEMQKLLSERNKKCRLLKGVPEPAAEKDNSGINILSAALAVLGFAAIFIFLLTFIIIPNGKYNAANALYQNEKYEEALFAFENLGNYKDSKAKVDLIKEKLYEDKYIQAENCYKTQDYVEAMRLYSELGDYKDSKDRIEQIYNKFAGGGEVYFGVYEGAPVAWKILKTEESRMLLITQDPVETLAFNDELKNIAYETSTVRNWLNDDFLSEFSDDQRSRIIKSDDGLNDDIFLLTEEQYNEYSENLDLTTYNDWWLRTKTDAGMMYVYGESGDVDTYGESVVRNMGVRPCVWISLRKK
ncbi:MAG: hypothetical protein J5590_02310 [Clostridia bacterium]|nr:hypothetical protein [Clostridia bacterium]